MCKRLVNDLLGCKLTSPSKDDPLIFRSIFGEEACRVLRMTGSMISCHFDILANSERILMADLETEHLESACFRYQAFQVRYAPS